MALSKAERLRVAAAVAPKLRATGQRVRRVFITNKRGKVVRVASTAEVQRAVLARAQIEFGESEAKFPVCGRCHHPFMVPARKPGVQVYCRECKRAVVLENKRRARKQAAALRVAREEQKARRAGTKRETAAQFVCADCGQTFGRRSTTGRPPTRCDGCRAKAKAAEKVRYRQQDRVKVLNREHCKRWRQRKALVH